MNRIRLVMVALVVFALQLGCAVQSPVVTYYLLQPDAGALATKLAAPALQPLRLQLLSVELSPYLDRPQLLRRLGSGEQLELAEFHQWGGQLRQQLADLMLPQLATALETPYVIQAPTPLRGGYDYQLALEFVRFEQQPSGHVLLEVRWRLYSGHGGELVALKSSLLQSPAALPDNAYAEVVKTMSQLLAQFTSSLAVELSAVVNRQPTDAR
ncbi:MAG: membrane integrity-associated transporter subunit PqiC [Gammaproteobacteria bacterium]|nr:membrane integrity-associated transporter subunit PqiC [Gammaproteobacteria bacterium]